MNMVTDLLTTLGNHFSLVVIGSAEVLAAVFLLGKTLKKKKTPGRKKVFQGGEAAFLAQMDSRDDQVCIVVRSSDRMPVYATEGLENMLGVSFERIRQDVTCLDKNCEKKERSNRIWKNYLNWNGRDTQSYEIQLRDGRWIHMVLSTSTEGAYQLLSFTDATDVHDRMEQYEERLKAAEEESQSKTTFLNRMSHEIRTPMNGIMGMLTLAENTLTENAPARNYLDKAEELSGHLLALINDILDMSRIEAGKVELEKKSFSLRRMGRKLYDMFARNLESEGIHY